MFSFYLLIELLIFEKNKEKFLKKNPENVHDVYIHVYKIPVFFISSKISVKLRLLQNLVNLVPNQCPASKIKHQSIQNNSLPL